MVIFIVMPAEEDGIRFISLNRTFPSKTLRLTDFPAMLGRQPVPKDTDPSRVLSFSSKVVSRQHAELFIRDNKLLIRDTKSSTGTFLKSQRLAPRGETSQPFEINDAEVIRLGEDYTSDGELHQCIKMVVYLPPSMKVPTADIDPSYSSNTFTVPVERHLLETVYAPRQPSGIESKASPTKAESPAGFPRARHASDVITANGDEETERAYTKSLPVRRLSLLFSMPTRPRLICASIREMATIA